MAEISEVRQELYNTLKTWADAQSPALSIFVRGQEKEPANNETFLQFNMLTAKPEGPFVGTGYRGKENGVFQVTVIGPEQRKLKALEMLASDIGFAFWPASQRTAPTIGTDPVVRITKVHVYDHPSPDDGTLASICDIYWHSYFARA